MKLLALMVADAVAAITASVLTILWVFAGLHVAEALVVTLWLSLLLARWLEIERRP